MTDTAILQLRGKIVASRMRLMKSHPFFAIMLMHVNYIAVPDMKQISTDGRTIFFSPMHMERLYPAELDYTLCHQLMHILQGDIWRSQEYCGDYYHYCCDYCNNALLKKAGLEEGRCVYYRCKALTGTARTKFQDHAAYYFTSKQLDNLFSEVELKQVRLTDSDQYWGYGGTLPPNSVMILKSVGEEIFPAPYSLQNSPGPTTEQMLWEENPLLSEEDKHYTTYEKRIVASANSRSVNWWELLSEHMQTEYDYSFAPPDRRYNDSTFFLPDLNEPRRGQDILFWVDTSGSIDNRILGKIYAEMFSAVNQLGGSINGKLGFFDDIITPPVEFSSAAELEKIVPMGNGGTNFFIIFDYVRKNYAQVPPACMVIFTDGEGVFPNERAALGVPVIWILTGKKKAAPWGKSVWIT